MIPLASGEADEQNIPTSQSVSICLTFLGLQLNSGFTQTEARLTSLSTTTHASRLSSKRLAIQVIPVMKQSTKMSVPLRTF